MNKFTRSNLLIYLTLIIIGFVYSSCISTKQLKYFQDIPDSTRLHNIRLAPYVPPTVQPEDVLSIAIATLDEKSTESINALNGSAAAGAGGDLVGYAVDSLGYIQMPVLGNIKLQNLTIAQATEVIRKKASVYFLDPVITVKTRSFRVNVLGEVNKPGVIPVPTGKINVIELLTLAGDLTPYAKRNDILILRKNTDNTMSTIRFDLTKSDIIRSSNFYLQSNDVVLVQPSNAKAISSDATFTRNLTLITVGLSVFTTILYLFKK